MSYHRAHRQRIAFAPSAHGEKKTREYKSYGSVLLLIFARLLLAAWAAYAAHEGDRLPTEPH